MEKIVRVVNVGKLGYLQALKLQKYLANLHHVNQGNSDSVILVEHPPVFTIGIRTKDYTREDEERLKQTGAEFHRTNRGGLITFHGPGQLVVYPILNLKNYKSSMKWYICQIEKTVIDICKKLSVEAMTSPHTGVWIGDNKVCAIGVHGSRFITTHGLALNCCNDLDWYRHIVPCGIKDKGVTTLTKELNRVVTIDEVVPLFLDSFKKYFMCQYVEHPEIETKELLQLSQ